MNAENIDLTPDPEFIKLLSEFLPHKRTISHRLPNGNMQDEVLPGTNFMEDSMRVHQNRSPDLSDPYTKLFTVERSMWTQPYVEEVRNFLVSNNLNPDLLANIWLLRCRIWFILINAAYAERNRRNYDSEQLQNINIIKNKVLPFMKQLQGDKYLSHADGYVHSVSFKSNKPGAETLKLEGHLAANMYFALQEMAYKFLEGNEGFSPDMQTDRFRTAIGKVARGSYHILRQWGTFALPRKKTPPIQQLAILKNLIELAANKEGLLENRYENSRPEEQLRKFFL